MNKETGVTYIYESQSYWDKEKKQPRSKRVCVGKLAADGTFISSKRLSTKEDVAKDPAVTVSATVVGPSIVLDTITQRLGLDDLLKSCFPKAYQQIKAMAYYLAVQGTPLSRCEIWSKSHMPRPSPIFNKSTHLRNIGVYWYRR